MKIPRRQFLHLAAGAAVLPAVSRVAFAETYPSRPVHLFVGFPPGGPGDIIARLMGQWLSERLGQQFIIENRPGAASNVGTEAVVSATPDGYTTPSGHFVKRDQRDALRHPKLQFHPRYRAGGRNFQRTMRDGSQSIVSSKDCSRVHRLCEGQSGQDQHGVGWQRQRATCSRRIVQIMTGVDNFTCRIAALHLHSPTCSAVRYK